MKNRILKILHPFSAIRDLRLKRVRNNSQKYDDLAYIQKVYSLFYHKKPDLINPKTYQEKLQWLKLYYRKPEYTKLVDKFLVREYVKETIGSEYLIPLLGVWDNPESIDFKKLPNKFVLKCNHNSGLGMCICLDKEKINPDEVREKLSQGLKQNYYSIVREWPYKDVPRKIICEKYICNADQSELSDYKFFCFDGKFQFLLVCSDRHTNLSNDWYDNKLNHIKCINGPKNRKTPVYLPNNIRDMISIAEKLAFNIPHVRVDLYSVDGKIYFGEMTFFESSGFLPFKPKKYDRIFGDCLILPEKYEEIQ